MDDLKRRLPNITVTRLRICVIRPQQLAVCVRHTNRALVKSPVVPDFKIQGEGLGLDAEFFIRRERQRFWHAIYHDDARIRPIRVIIASAIGTVGYTQTKNLHAS